MDPNIQGRYDEFPSGIVSPKAPPGTIGDSPVFSENPVLDIVQREDVAPDVILEPIEKAGLFFDLMKMRHNKRCTIITSQLGFDEWGAFLKDRHLTAAILDRITENCTVFNMSKCISIRKKRITYATEKNTAE